MYVVIDVHKHGWEIRPCDVLERTGEGLCFLHVYDHPGNANNDYRVRDQNPLTNMVVKEKHVFETEQAAQAAIQNGEVGDALRSYT